MKKEQSNDREAGFDTLFYEQVIHDPYAKNGLARYGFFV